MSDNITNMANTDIM